MGIGERPIHESRITIPKFASTSGILVGRRFTMALFNDDNRTAMLLEMEALSEIMAVERFRDEDEERKW